MLSSLQQLVLDQYQTLPSDKRIIVLHPNYVLQHIILDRLLQEQAAYVRFDGTHLTVAQLNEQLEASLAHQGTNLNELKTLILDECDRSVPSEIDHFLPDLFARLNPRTQLVLLPRLSPRCLLDDPALRKVTAFIPYDSSVMMWDYAAQNENNTALLEVRALGPGYVFLDGKPVENWDGVLPRSLFFYLVDRGMTTRAEIFETFWPNLSAREATNVFHVTKRKISEVLGLDLTAYMSGFYHISHQIHLSYDAALFSEMVQNSAVGSPDEALSLLERAIALYRGSFLTTVNMPWAEKRRHEFTQIYAEALVGLAKAKERNGEILGALGFYLRAASTNRQREDLAYNMMRIYRELNMRHDAQRIYHRLAAELQSNLGVQPTRQIQELMAQIEAEMR